MTITNSILHPAENGRETSQSVSMLLRCPTIDDEAFNVATSDKKKYPRAEMGQICAELRICQASTPGSALFLIHPLF